MKKKSLQQKLATHFGVKISHGSIETKVDQDSRTVKGIGNTYFWIDSDIDMLIPNCAAKSISDRGPNSQATAKIKHQADHVLNTKNVVGRFTVLDERKIDGLDVLYFESYIPETSKGNDDLINYQEMIYDNHSIGFRYKKLEMAVLNSENEAERKNWEEFYPLALNPEVADKHGFFWVVKEIELFEISIVSYGANSLTPNLGSKSKEENNRLKTEILERIESLTANKILSAESKEEKKQINLESLQLKQIITDLELKQPSKKDTSIVEPLNNDTDTEEESKSKSINLINSISQNF